MKKVALQLERDMTTYVIVTALKMDLEELTADWAKVYARDKGFVFSIDRKEDLEEISKHIAAMKKILRYYGEDA